MLDDRQGEVYAVEFLRIGCCQAFADIVGCCCYPWSTDPAVTETAHFLYDLAQGIVGCAMGIGQKPDWMEKQQPKKGRDPNPGEPEQG